MRGIGVLGWSGSCCVGVRIGSPLAMRDWQCGGMKDCLVLVHVGGLVVVLQSPLAA